MHKTNVFKLHLFTVCDFLQIGLEFSFWRVKTSAVEKRHIVSVTVRLFLQLVLEVGILGEVKAMDISASRLNLKCVIYAVGMECAHLRAGGVSRQPGGMLNPGSGHAKQGIAINPGRLLVLRN